MPKFLFSVTSLLLTSVVSAQVLDKTSSFTIEQDAITGNWNLQCTSEVSGFDKSLDHNVGVDLRLSNGTGSIQIFDLTTNILAGEKSFMAVEDRTDFEIRKAGTRLKVNIDVSDYYPAGTGDTFYCVINIAKVLAPTEENSGLYAVTMTQSINNDGTPQVPGQCVATRLVASNGALVACDPLPVNDMLEFEFADRTLYYDTRRDHIRETGWIHYSQQDCIGLVGLHDPSGIGITNVYGVSVDGDVYVSDGTSPITWTPQSKVLFAYGDHSCSNESLNDVVFFDAELALDHTSYPTPYTVVPEAQ
jgi:hypothetical protein